MEKILYAAMCAILFLCCSSSDESEANSQSPFTLPDKAIVLAEQASKSVVILDASTYRTVWSWKPEKAGVPSNCQTWFHNPSEVKPVFNNQYILMTASGVAVALIRIADSKLMYYAYVGENPHSAEILPDGNLVAVSSTDGKLRTFMTDTIKGTGKWFASYELPSAHNVVWDLQRELLYTTEGIKLCTYKYNFNRKEPRLQDRSVIFELPNTESCGHDLFPVYNKIDVLWITTNENVWQYDIKNNKAELIYPLYAVKSVCNSADGVLMLYPTTEWWSDGLINEKGKKLFNIYGAKIYKGRWVMNNTFSYPKEHKPKFE